MTAGTKIVSRDFLHIGAYMSPGIVCIYVFSVAMLQINSKKLSLKQVVIPPIPPPKKNK